MTETVTLFQSSFCVSAVISRQVYSGCTASCFRCLYRVPLIAFLFCVRSSTAEHCLACLQQCLRHVDGSLTPVPVSWFSTASQQLSGINTIFYFSTSIFKDANVSNGDLATAVVRARNNGLGSGSALGLG